MQLSARSFLFTLILIGLLQTTVVAGPLAYTACLAKCMGFTLPTTAVVPPAAIGASLACAAICAPVLMAPTP